MHTIAKNSFDIFCEVCYSVKGFMKNKITGMLDVFDYSSLRQFPVLSSLWFVWQFVSALTNVTP